MIENNALQLCKTPSHNSTIVETFSCLHQIWFCKAKVRWEGNAQAHTSTGTVFVYYLFLESQDDLLSASARRELDRELIMCLHMHKLTHQPVAARGYVGTSSSANQLLQGQPWKHWTTAATSHQCPPYEINSFHSPTRALSVSLPLNLFCLFWFLSRAFFPLLALSLSAWCLLTCSPSQYTPLYCYSAATDCLWSTGSG